MDIKIKFTSTPPMEEIAKKFAAFPSIVAPFLRTASTFSALAVEREAKILSPVDTGRLRASIATSLGVANKGLSAIVQTNVEYAHIVHEGLGRGRNSIPRPFMRKGAEIARPKIEEVYKMQITKALELLK